MAKEIYSGDVATKQKDDLNLALDVDLVQVRKNEDIVTDVASVNSGYLQDLAFAEEEMTIRLEQSSDKYAASTVFVAVNGQEEWLPVGHPLKIKRKFVEVLARCKSDIFDTIRSETQDGDSINKLSRRTSMKHPFSVIHDPNPKGYEWLVQTLSAA